MLVAQSHIYLHFTDKMSTLTQFPLEPRCEDYYFLDQALKDFEHGLDSVIRDHIDTPELDASFHEADAMPSSSSSGLLCSVNANSDNSRPQPAPSIKSHKLWFQVMALYLPVPQAGKMLSSKLIHYFSSHVVAFLHHLIMSL